MRLCLLCLLLIGCKGDEKKAVADPPKPQEAATPQAGADKLAADPPTPQVDAKPADDMDEKMRHCPLALSGAQVAVRDVDGGVQFEIRGAKLDDIRQRARHVVEFSAGRSQAGMHGGGSGGGRMRNCPVVTNGVVIRVDDIEGGARLIVSPMNGGSVDELRRETKARLDKFAFEGVTITRQ